ncbi:MAG: DUF4391 domain-containing protein [Bacteroidales bacterium]|nr:DUF4391 domain-containing protein [Bacteroidales bacterium]
MLHLPPSTEINRALPKTVLYKHFNLKGGQQEHFDSDVSRMVLVNCIDAETVPALREGQEVSSIYVLQVALKKRNYDAKNIVMLFRLIPQRMVLALLWGGEVRLATYEGQLVLSPWMKVEEAQLNLTGIDLDDVWAHLVMQIGNITITEGRELKEQIVEDARQEELRKKIEALEKRARAEKQPRRKMDLFEEIQKLRKTL